MYQSLHGTLEGRAADGRTKKNSREEAAATVLIPVPEEETEPVPNGAPNHQRAYQPSCDEPVNNDHLPAGGSGRAGTATSNGWSKDGGPCRGRAGRGRTDRVNLLGLAMAQYPDYRVIVTGHSLGAGAATVLAFLLRYGE